MYVRHSVAAGWGILAAWLWVQSQFVWAMDGR